MSDEAKLRHALFAHIEQKTDEVWTSIDDLQKAMEAVPPADRSGPEWGGDGELSKRFIELMKRLGDSAAVRAQKKITDAGAMH